MTASERADEEAPAPVRVLYVCTANRCRSPFAEHLLRRRAGSLPVAVASAGLMDAGHPTPPHGVQVARERGLDLGAHRSSSLRGAHLDGIDLVLTMERNHSRELVVARPELSARIFTVRQFDRWRERTPQAPAERLGPWLDEVASPDVRERLFGPPEDDVPDPLTGPRRAWRRLADELERHADQLVTWLCTRSAPDSMRRSSAS